MSDPLRLTPPIFPTPQQSSPTVLGASVRVSSGSRTTGSAGSTDSFIVAPPSNAVALIGISINPTAAGVASYGLLALQVQDPSGGNVSQVASVVFSRGTKTAWGCYPLDPSQQQLLAGITPNDASVTYVAIFYFLVGSMTVTPIPFAGIGGSDEIVTQTATSAANTAQTVDFAGIGNTTQVEILSATFYTSAGTATGNFGYFDGTTRVDIDTTAAVASYSFNLGKSGGRAVFANSGQAVTNKVRFLIGAAGVGNTTTLVVTYRVSVVR